MQRRATFALLLTFVAALAACGDDKATGPLQLGFSFSDPSGDTLDTDVAGEPRAVDLVQLSGTVARDSLIVTLEFADPILRFSSEDPGAVVGFLELDTDENPGTGDLSLVDQAASDTPRLGADYYVYFDDDGADHMYAGPAPFLGDPDADVIVPVTFQSNSFTVRVPLSELGDDDGNFTMRAYIVVSQGFRLTDFAPNAPTDIYRVTSEGSGTVVSSRVASGVELPRALRVPVLERATRSWPLGRHRR